METSPSLPTPRAAEAGISLLEVLIAVAVMTLGFLALAQTLITTHSLRQNSDDRRALFSAFRIVGEEIRGVSEQAREAGGAWSQAVVAALQPGGLLGNVFDVRGLEPPAGRANVGSIRVVLDETATDADLGVPLGMPRDLDGDGRADVTDVSTDASMLPVVVTMSWRSQGEVREFRRGFYLTEF